MKEKIRQTIVTVNFAEKSLMGNMDNLDPIWAKLYNLEYLMISSKDLFEMLQDDGAYQIDISDTT